MGFLDRFINSIRGSVDKETGSAVQKSSEGLDEVENVELTTTTYKEMLNSNAVVNSLYLLISQTALSSNSSVLGGNDAQTKVVNQILYDPEHAGGMSTPLDLVLEQMTQAVIYGFSAFEKVFTVRSDGLIGLKKIAFRPQTGITIKSDPNGGFNGFKQAAIVSGEEKEVEIPVDRGFLYTYGKSFNNLYGRSAFRSVVDDHNDKLSYKKFQKRIWQELAYAIIVAQTRPDASGNQTHLTDLVTKVAKRKVKATIGVPADYELKTLTQSNFSGGSSIIEMLEYLDKQVYQAILAAFMILSVSSGSGSNALAKTQSNIFLQFIFTIQKSIEAHINAYVLPQLYLVNWGETAEIGKFKFDPISQDVKDLMDKLLQEFVRMDMLSDEAVNSLAKLSLQRANVNVADDENVIKDIGDGEAEQSQTE